MSNPQPSQQAGQLALKAARIAQRALIWLVLWIVLGLSSIVLFILALLGHTYAGVALMLLVFATLFGLGWNLYRLGKRAAPPSPFQPQTVNTFPSETQAPMANLEALLRQQQLVPALQTRLETTVQATRAALQATSSGGLLTREAHEARAAAEQDIPEALAAYRQYVAAGQASSYGEVLLSEQLQLIERRMTEIAQQEQAGQARDLEAGRLYLQDKYRQNGG